MKYLLAVFINIVMLNGNLFIASITSNEVGVYYNMGTVSIECKGLLIDSNKLAVTRHCGLDAWEEIRFVYKNYTEVVKRKDLTHTDNDLYIFELSGDAEVSPVLLGEPTLFNFHFNQDDEIVFSLFFNDSRYESSFYDIEMNYYYSFSNKGVNPGDSGSVVYNWFGEPVGLVSHFITADNRFWAFADFEGYKNEIVR